YKVRLGDLPVPGVHYAVHNGIKQSVADSKAGVESGEVSVPAIAKLAAGGDEKAKVRWAKLTVEAGDNGAGSPTDEAMVTAVTAGVVKARQDKRFESIVAGTMAVREDGGRLNPRDAWINATASREIADKYKEAKREMRKGADKANELAKYIAHHADRLA